ncbi:MAG: fibronectin type III domain-containing protein [Lentisphaerae bacterium]|nr:fibronectin type III domain-containing protein [Lentisphaerota bacterium]
MAATAAASIALLPLAAKAVAGTNWNVLYETTNLAGHELAYEPNPGTTGGPPCSLSDVSLSVFADYGTVTANANRTNIFVNAIGYRKFTETYTNGQAVSLGIYRYRGSLRLPAVPAPSVVQTQNAQTAQMMIQVWDGREELWDSNSNSLEATMYWDLNPWNADFGKVKIYTMNTGALVLVNTGITVPPDTNWHTFELVADFSNRTFVSAGMDGIVVNLSTVSIAQVTHTDWSTNVAISMTAESMNTWPGDSFSYVFWWSTEFRGLDFARQEYVADTEAPVPNPMTWSAPPVPMNGTSVTMTASAASDDAGVVYYFEEITGGAGGSSSGWQESPSFIDTALASGTRYSYRVKARDKSALSNETAYSEIYSAVTPLSAPVGVTASDGAFTDKVQVTWGTVSNASGYEVWRSGTNDTNSAALLAGTIATTNYDDTNTVSDATYYYWVKATNAAGAGAFSSSDSGWRSSFAAVGPTIKANGRNVDSLTVSSNDTVAITVSMNADIYVGTEVDWWIVAYGSPAGWFYMNEALAWTPFSGSLSDLHRVYGGALFDLLTTTVLPAVNLPVGTWDFWFAVDYPMNGILNTGAMLYDHVNVIVR